MKGDDRMPPKPPKLPLEETQPIQKRIQTVLTANWIFVGLTFALSFVLAFAQAFGAEFLSVLFGYNGLTWMVLTLGSPICMLLTTILSSSLTLSYARMQTGESAFSELKKTRFQPKWVLYGISGGALAALLLNFVLLFIQWLTHVDIPEAALDLTPTQPLAAFVMFIASVIAAPICEELVFRGTICRQLARTNKGFAVIFSALLFAMAHMNFDQGLPVLGLGLVYGFVYIRSGSIWVPILCHMFNNLYAFIVTLLSSMGLWSITGTLSTIYMWLCMSGSLLLIMEGREIQAANRMCLKAKTEWKAVGTNVSFWVLVSAFIACSCAVVFFV